MTNSKQNKEEKKVGENSKYIIPTKKEPVFLANCDHFGYIQGPYYDILVGNCCSPTFSINYEEAIKYLHNYIIKNKKWMLKKFPIKCKFEILFVDGTIDKYGDKITKKVYSISLRQAIKYKLI